MQKSLRELLYFHSVCSGVECFVGMFLTCQHLLLLLTLHVVGVLVFATVPEGVPGCVDVLKAGVVGRSGSWKHNMSISPLDVKVCECIREREGGYDQYGEGDSRGFEDMGLGGVGGAKAVTEEWLWRKMKCDVFRRTRVI